MVYLQNLKGEVKPLPASKPDASGCAVICHFSRLIVLLTFLVSVCLCLMPISVFAQGFPPVGGGGTCTGMINPEGYQGQQSAVNNGLYLCSGGVWVLQPLIIGTTASACNATWSGGIRYSSAQGCIELCDGTSWQCI